MASFSQILFVIGIVLLASAAKWGIGWALFGGLIALAIPLALPFIAFLFRPYR